MRNALVGLVVGSVIVLALADVGFRPNHSWAQLPGATGSSSGSAAGTLIALSSDATEGCQQVVVIDTQNQSMTVYHVEHAKGTISLRSVRNIRADFLMDEYNTDVPLPREIRAILKQRQ